MRRVPMFDRKKFIDDINEFCIGEIPLHNSRSGCQLSKLNDP